MEWQKLMEVEIGLRDGSVHASAVVVLTFASHVKMGNGKPSQKVIGDYLCRLGGPSRT